jgi:signal transduction histidine kinase
MNARSVLQDSGLPDSRLLARLLQAGTLVLDENDALTFASAGACQLFGVDDEAALRDRWSDLREQLRVERWPHTLPDGDAYHGRADLLTPAGPRAIRFEMHGMADAGSMHRAVLVRDRARVLATDRALLLASEAQANRHVLTGLVHAAKGPLNNFNLTLALLSTGVARGDVLAATPEAAARRTRYIDVLQKEAARLASCIDEIHALTVHHEPSHEPIDLAAMSADCARVLRHGATMREVSLELDVPAQPVLATGDPQLVRLALLSFAICVLEFTPAGGRVAWRVTPGEPTRAASVAITTSRPVLPPTLASALFRLSCTAESDYSGAIAARLIVEAQGGDVVLHDAGDGTPGIMLHIPADA